MLALRPLSLRSHFSLLSFCRVFSLFSFLSPPLAPRCTVFSPAEFMPGVRFRVWSRRSARRPGAFFRFLCPVFNSSAFPPVHHPCPIVSVFSLSSHTCPFPFFGPLSTPVLSPFPFLPAARRLPSRPSSPLFPSSLLALPLYFPRSFSVLLIRFPLAPSLLCPRPRSHPFSCLLPSVPLSSPSPTLSPLSALLAFFRPLSPAFPLPRSSG